MAGIGLDPLSIAGDVAKIGLGAAQYGASIGAFRKARNLFPRSEDPESRGYLNELNNIRKGISTGSGYSEAVRQLRGNMQTAINNAFNTAGGYAGGALGATAAINEGTGNAYGNIFSEGQKEGDLYNQLYGKQLGEITSRKADLDLLKYSQAYQKANDMRSAGFNNLGLGTADTYSDLFKAKVDDSGTGNYDDLLERIKNSDMQKLPNKPLSGIKNPYAH